MRFPPVLALAAVLGLSLGSTACIYNEAPGSRHAVVHKTGPPPHAPAHGYRHKQHHHGVELRFDTGLGVYVVVGRPSHYYHHDHYYRFIDGIWQMSVSLDSGWKATSHKHMPPGLAKKARGHKHRGKKKGHKNPAKHGY